MNKTIKSKGHFFSNSKPFFTDQTNSATLTFSQTLSWFLLFSPEDQLLMSKLMNSKLEKPQKWSFKSENCTIFLERFLSKKKWPFEILGRMQQVWNQLNTSYPPSLYSFFNMLGPRRNFFLFFSPLYVQQYQEKERKKIEKIKPIFQNQEKLKLIPKHCDSMNFVMIIKSRLLYYYICYLQRDEKMKKQRKTKLLFCKKYHKKHKKQTV